MEDVIIYLKTALFTLPKEDGHVPKGAMILSGKIREQIGGGLTVAVASYRSDVGKALAGPAQVLYLPYSKIDHIQLIEG